jgi:hypothetical protein
VRETRGADLLIEGGDLAGGNTRLDLEKAMTAVEVLFGMPTRYDVLGVGPRDLALPLEDWGGYLAAYDAPVVAADLKAMETAFQPRPFVEKDVRGTKVRVVSLAMSLPEGLRAAQPPKLGLLEPAMGWQRGLAGADDATLRILLVHGEPARTRALARELQPRPDLVIGCDDSVHEPPAKPELVGDVPVVFPGIRGRFLVDLHFGRTAGGAAIPQYEIVPLRGSETKPDAGQDAGVREAIRKHRLFVASEDLLEAMAEAVPAPGGLAYVGNERCGSCHQDDHLLWKHSKHGKAWQTLVDAENDPKRYGWPVTEYPDCVSCHVVGYGQKSGFVNSERTPQLADVGCERCHGPGSAHSDDPRVKMGKVGGGQPPSMVCTECHDFEQSPTFDYNQRWLQIEHGKAKAKRPR